MMVGHGLLLHVLMDGDLIPGVHLVKLVNTEEQTPLSTDSRVPAAPFLIPPNTARRYFYQLKKLIGVYCTSLVSQSTHKS